MSWNPWKFPQQARKKEGTVNPDREPSVQVTKEDEAIDLIAMLNKYGFSSNESHQLVDIYNRNKNRSDGIITIENIEKLISRNEGGDFNLVNYWLHDLAELGELLYRGHKEGKITAEQRVEFESRIGVQELSSLKSNVEDLIV